MNSESGTARRKTPAFWPITYGFGLLSLVLGWVAAFSYVGIGLIVLGGVLLAVSGGAVLSRWTQAVWHAYALVFLVVLALVILGYLAS